MDYQFTESEIKEELHIVELEEMVYHISSISGSGKNYVLTGKAKVDGETFPYVQVDVELAEALEEVSAKAVMDAQWDWYDYAVKW